MTGAGVLRLGTRRSPMAMAQSRQVAAAITRLTGRDIELVGITSRGDVSAEQLTQIGGTGVFVSALRTALLAGDVDFAVHSLKDLPTGPAEGIALAAVPVRDDPRDALIGPAAPSSRTCRAAHGSVPGRRAGPRSCCCCARICCRCRCAGTRTPGSPRWNQAIWTLLCSGTRAWAGSGDSTRSPSCSSRTRCSRRPGRVRSRLSVLPAGKTSLRCWPAWMTRSAGQRRPRNAACSARFRRAARPRWARMLPGRMYFGSAAWWSQPTGGWRFEAARVVHRQWLKRSASR